MHKIKMILPFILANIKGKPRYKPNIKWDNKIWTRNLFRVWEMLFWREYGVRIESSHDFSMVDGVVFRNEKFYTWESSIGFVEVCIKEYFKKLLNLEVNTQKVQFAQAFAVVLLGFEMKFTHNSLMFPLVAGAITFGSSGQSNGSGASSSFSYSMTNVAGDYLLAASGSNGAPSSATYAGVSLGTAITTDTTVSNPFACALWGKRTPATGANTFAVSKSSAGSNDWYSNVVSYSGTNTTSQPDAFNHKYASSGTTNFLPITVVASNCWLAGWIFDDFGAVGAGSGFTARGSAPGTVSQWVDSNGTVSTGVQNINFTSGNGQFVGLGVSIAPPAAAPTTYANLLTMLM